MKKLIPLLAVVGAAAALVAYKIKKDQQQKLVDLDEGLLEDNDEETREDEAVILTDDSNDVQVNDEEETQVEEVSEEPKEDETVEEAEEYDEVFTHLTKKYIVSLKNQAEDRLNEMEQDGDVHSIDRPVTHSFSFNNADDREAFKAEVVNKGFVIANGENELVCDVLHIIPLDIVKLMANVYYLADVAKEHNGEYLSWSCEIAK